METNNAKPTNDSNENNRTVSKGTILIAINKCIMETDRRPTLTLEKEYAVKESSAKMIAVIDDENQTHYFDRIEIHKFFKIKSTPTDKKTTAEEFLTDESYFPLLRENDEDSNDFVTQTTISNVREYATLRLTELLSKAGEVLPDEMIKWLDKLQVDFDHSDTYNQGFHDAIGVVKHVLPNKSFTIVSALLLAKELDIARLNAMVTDDARKFYAENATKQLQQEIQEKEREIERLKEELDIRRLRK